MSPVLCPCPGFGDAGVVTAAFPVCWDWGGVRLISTAGFPVQSSHGTGPFPGTQVHPQVPSVLSSSSRAPWNLPSDAEFTGCLWVLPDNSPFWYRSL